MGVAGVMPVWHHAGVCIIQNGGTVCMHVQVFLVKDVWASVRAEAIRTVTQCLSLVKHLPSRSEFRVGGSG